jgi:hypothetical protein
MNCTFPPQPLFFSWFVFICSQVLFGHLNWGGKTRLIRSTVINWRYCSKGLVLLCPQLLYSTCLLSLQQHQQRQPLPRSAAVQVKVFLLHPKQRYPQSKQYLRIKTASCSVFLTGRFFGRKTKKGQNTNISRHRPDKSAAELWQDFPKKGPKRGRILKIICFLYFFHIKVLKTWNFHRFLF